MTDSPTTTAAIELLRARQAKGLSEYGCTLDASGLNSGAVLDHAIEEAADLLVYLLRLKALMDSPDLSLIFAQPETVEAEAVESSHGDESEAV